MTDRALVARDGRLPAVQYLRALAAIAVVLFHASVYLEAKRNDAAFLSVFDGRFGGFGVSLFFVISGYLMARLSGSPSPSLFLLHRIARIYPIYLIVVAVVLAGNWWSDGMTPVDWAAYSLVPGPHTYVLGTEWTLPFEITFYVVVAAAMVVGMGRQIHRVAIVWLALIFICLVIAPHWATYSTGGMFPTLPYLLLSEKCTAFALGLMIPVMLARRRFGRTALVAGVLLIAASAALPAFGNVLMALGCTLLVGVAATPTAGRSFKALSLLGDWSFALYLVHVPVIVWLMVALPASWPSAVVWGIAVIVPVAVSVGAGMLDIGLYRRVKRWCDASTPRQRALVCGLFLTVFVVGGMHVDGIERRDRSTLEAANELGRRFDAQPVTGALATRAPPQDLLASTELRGYLDTVSAHPKQKGVAVVTGWVLDTSDKDSAPVALFFINGRYVGAVLPTTPRKDVIAALGKGSSSRVSFSRSITRDACPNSDRLEALILSGDRFAVMGLPPQASACPASAL